MSENASDALGEFPEFITESRGEIFIKVAHIKRLITNRKYTGSVSTYNAAVRLEHGVTLTLTFELLMRRLSHWLL